MDVPLRAIVAVAPVVELLLMTNCPVAAPVLVGLNWSCRFRVWLGARVAGTVPPTRVKPAPEMDAELTVTGEVPVEVRVRVWVVAVFTVILPKFRAEVLIVS